MSSSGGNNAAGTGSRKSSRRRGRGRGGSNGSFQRKQEEQAESSVVSSADGTTTSNKDLSNQSVIGSSFKPSASAQPFFPAESSSSAVDSSKVSPEDINEQSPVDSLPGEVEGGLDSVASYIAAFEQEFKGLLEDVSIEKDLSDIPVSQFIAEMEEFLSKTEANLSQG